jgi:hypothetical protein
MIRGCVASRFFRIILAASFAGALAAGCTRAEIENRAWDYNTALAESTNEAILLNAVRASQYAPMSFTSMGDVTATPNLSGSAEGTFNLDPHGLTTYALSPKLTVGGGFNEFKISNSNEKEFMKRIRDPIKIDIVRYFQGLNWPQELVAHMAIHSYDISRQDLARIERDSDRACLNPPDGWKAALCQLIEEGKAERAAANCYPYRDPAIITILNTGRSLCGMSRFQILTRRLIVLDISFEKYGRKLRSAHGMLYYLGELIAAQNYSLKPYFPTILMGTADGPTRVGLFVVRRGTPAGGAAVSVSYHGEQFYIPRPDFGSREEDRSLQALDFVTYVVAAQTAPGQLPKSSSIFVVR